MKQMAAANRLVVAAPLSRKISCDEEQIRNRKDDG